MAGSEQGGTGFGLGVWRIGASQRAWKYTKYSARPLQWPLHPNPGAKTAKHPRPGDFAANARKNGEGTLGGCRAVLTQSVAQNRQSVGSAALFRVSPSPWGSTPRYCRRCSPQRFPARQWRPYRPLRLHGHWCRSKATLHNSRLTAQAAYHAKIFRAIFQKCSPSHQGLSVLFGSYHKKFSGALHHLELRSAALKLVFVYGINAGIHSHNSVLLFVV